jgi:hypothetical protein
MLEKSGVPFTSFNHRFIMEDELAYKLGALEKGRKCLRLDKWPNWKSKTGKILNSMRQACKPDVSRNLLEHKYGELKGSYSALYRLEEKADIENFEFHIFDLFQNIDQQEEDLGASFNRFAKLLKEQSLGCKWEFIVYFLYLMRPERFFPIRSTHFERVLKFYGVDCKIAHNVDWWQYRLILDVAESVKQKLRMYGNPSAIEVQSYLWVVSYLLKDGLGDTELSNEIDFDEELRRRQQKEEEKQRIGLLGERYVFENEVERLETAGRGDLAKKVRLVSAESDAEGYDILSFQPSGQERHIEVKSTCRSESGTDCFWLSDNEVQTAISDELGHWFEYGELTPLR